MAVTFEPKEPFFAAIGSAITVWVHVEKALLMLFLSALDTQHKRPAAAAYHAIINFRTKLQFVDAALTTRLGEKRTGPHSTALAPHPLLEEWARLEKRLSKKSTKRGYLAHYEFINLATDGDHYRRLLSPPLNNPLNREAIFSDDAMYGIEQIKAVEVEFYEISIELKNFVARVDEALGQNTVYP